MKIPKSIIVLVLIFSLVTLLAALEEMSWGQHLFHFNSTNYFKTHNYQHETNLHNLMPAAIFSSIIYFCVYSFYIFIPLFLRLAKNRYKKLKKIEKYLPSFHISLIILFASSFQIYFYNDFGVIFDFITLIVAFLLLALTISKEKNWDKILLLHYIFVVFSSLLFMSSHSIFNYFNAQYEIREMFVVLATLIYFRYLLHIITKKV